MTHRHFRVQVGRWCIENWHVYRLTPHVDAKTGKNRWTMWDRVL